MPGDKYRSIQNPRMYRALRRAGYDKTSAARISNAKTPGTRVKETETAAAIYERIVESARAAGHAPGPWYVNKADFDESKVSRSDGGQFSSGSGGGAAKKKPAKVKKPKLTPEQRAAERQAKRDKNRADVMNRLAINPASSAALQTLADYGGPDSPDPDPRAIEQAGFVEAGLVERFEDGSYAITPAGRALLRVADAGDPRRAGDVIKRSRAAQAKKRQAKKKAMRPGRKRLYQSTYADAKAAGATPIEARLRAKQALRRHTAERAQRHAERAQLAIYKDATGADRWLSTSSTAYRDRDGEIVSRKALAGAVSTADTTGQRGPLRFWHVPGLDLGDCDFQATAHDGRFLIESGTFRSPAIARKMKDAGPLQVSIGFLHAATQPDAKGVFDDIAIFERSIVPAGYAANAMTSLTTKERTMDDRKRAAFVDLFGQELLDQLLTTTAATDKAAQDAGATYKETDAPPAWAQALMTRLDALEASTKADLPVVEAVVEDAAIDEAAAEAEEQDVVDMTAGELRQLISDVIAEHMGTMGSTLAEIDGKMASMGYQRAERKEADAAALKAQADAAEAQAAELAALKARIVEMEGLQPRQARLGVAVDATTAKAIAQQADPQAGDPLAQFLSGFNMNGNSH